MAPSRLKHMNVLSPHLKIHLKIGDDGSFQIYEDNHKFIMMFSDAILTEEKEIRNNVLIKITEDHILLNICFST